MSAWPSWTCSTKASATRNTAAARCCARWRRPAGSAARRGAGSTSTSRPRRPPAPDSRSASIQAAAALLGQLDLVAVRIEDVDGPRGAVVELVVERHARLLQLGLHGVE